MKRHTILLALPEERIGAPTPYVKAHILADIAANFSCATVSDTYGVWGGKIEPGLKIEISIDVVFENSITIFSAFNFACE